MKSMPASWISSLTCWKPISGAPFLMRVATGTPGVVTFALDLISLAMPIFSKQVDQIDAAWSGRISDRLRGQQRFLEIVTGFEIGFGCTGLHRDADARPNQIDLAAGDDLAVLGEGVE